MEELAKSLRALLLLELWTVQEAAQRSGATPPRLELLLADSGFGHKEVAEMLGKSSVAVSKAISRGRAARRGNQPADPADSREDSNV